LFDLFFAKIDEEKESRLGFLDGYRGSLALVVIVTHVKSDGYCELFNIIYGIHRTYAVDGFFVLSSFLLTYRLLTELRKASSLKQELSIVLKYCVRRFFRIYLVFVFIVTVFKYGPKITKGNYQYIQPPPPLTDNFASWKTIVTLNDVGYNHLWTIAPEIKFYFCIPLICWIGKRFGSFLPIYLIMCYMWLYFNEKQNFFGLSVNDLDLLKGSRLKPRFAVFFYGSSGGIALCFIESSLLIKSILKNELVKLVLSVLSMYTFYYGIHYRNTYFVNDLSTHQLESLSAFVWSTFILLLSSGHRSRITR
jgi:peptidoglycan/LPS O-acetylase OafA/YrhL